MTNRKDDVELKPVINENGDIDYDLICGFMKRFQPYNPSASMLSDALKWFYGEVKSRADKAEPAIDVDFDKAFEYFHEWECEAYSRGVGIDDEDIDKLRLFFDYIQSLGYLRTPREPIDEAIEYIEMFVSVSYKNGNHEKSINNDLINYIADIKRYHEGE